MEGGVQGTRAGVGRTRIGTGKHSAGRSKSTECYYGKSRSWHVEDLPCSVARRAQGKSAPMISVGRTSEVRGPLSWFILCVKSQIAYLVLVAMHLELQSNNYCT